MNTKSYVVETIKYIENHLFEEVSLDQLAKHFNYSKFHYARLFKAVLGENIGDYQMKRRLTVAAMNLLEESNGILNIAMMCGYSSQESFTRMFKAYFGVTPKVYRDRKIPYLNLYKYAHTQEDIEMMMSNGSAIEYQIIHKEAFEITGLLYHGDNRKHDVARIFNQAAQKLHFDEIYNHVDGVYGLDICSYEDIRNSEFDFIAGIDSRYLRHIDRADAQLLSKHIPENDYAMFTLTPMIEKIPIQIKKIWLSLLDDEMYIPCDNYAYEFYPNGFLPNCYEMEAYLFIPIKEQDRSKNYIS
jgi:AraC family transcriptional regulator